VLQPGWDDAPIRGHDVILEDGVFKMWFRSGSGANEGIGYAESPDGIDWTIDPGSPVLLPVCAGWVSRSIPPTIGSMPPPDLA